MTKATAEPIGFGEVAGRDPPFRCSASHPPAIDGERQLIENRSVDILNIHGSISDAMSIGWLAAEHGIPIALGNTMFEIGVHIAAALPEVEWLEYSFLSYNHLLDQPIEFCDGYAQVPDRPGHGLRIADSARSEGTPD